MKKNYATFLRFETKEGKLKGVGYEAEMSP